jgi:hypothetical protein
VLGQAPLRGVLLELPGKKGLTAGAARPCCLVLDLEAVDVAAATNFGQGDVVDHFKLLQVHGKTPRCVPFKTIERTRN